MADSLPSPTEHNFETESNFMGWFLHPTSTEAILCLGDGEHFETSGRFAACCLHEPCPMPTLCSANTLSFNNADIMDCGTDFSCVTMTLYQTPGSEGYPTANIMCGVHWAAHTIYRHLPPEPTTSPDPSPSTDSHLTSQAPTSLGSGSNHSNDDSPNQAWIAGAVVGPLGAIAAILFVIWWWRRRIDKKQDQVAQAAAAAEVEGGGGAEGGGSFTSGLLGPQKMESDQGTTWSSRHTASNRTSPAYLHGKYQSVPNSSTSPGFMMPYHSSARYQPAQPSPPPPHIYRDATPTELDSGLHGQGHAASELLTGQMYTYTPELSGPTLSELPDTRR
ncbi:hypothetical protein SODALDRAFT_330129 [Sodiomyces alkalinus F11]|uniref:Uncharacterized protein n=1 Tax=Sodiomyces alkalinus (strain CBS 110278 / VKM F-3762 / F11) TaxID=1314773 RepID=A0A3N2Q0Z4_SODAK|nr:hypothetical protein SODALDRAFT_330129 [Sodiomyces alkalinus F11]ROT40410.1 hypothetical protein SODALDRAFT_330129 [Sodiomyces alkalinus F11]